MIYVCPALITIIVCTPVAEKLPESLPESLQVLPVQIGAFSYQSRVLERGCWELLRFGLLCFPVPGGPAVRYRTYARKLERYSSGRSEGAAHSDLGDYPSRRSVDPMKHLNIGWNPATKEWFCAKCGRTSDHSNVHDAHKELDQYECQVPSVERSGAVPGTETVRLIRKPFNMTVRTERSGCRFAVTKTDEGKPVVKLELFHDTVAHLRLLTVGFEVLGGVTLEQARTLVDSMNEKIVGVIVTPK